MEDQQGKPSIDLEYQPLEATPGAGSSVQSGSKRWHTDLCACGGDIGICCTGFWCPCWLFGDNSRLLAEEGAGGGPACWNCCLFYAVPVAVNAACLLAIGAYTAQSAVSAAELAHIDYVRIATMLAALATFAHRRRRQVRQLEGIPADEAWDDWCSYFCLPQLAVCQEAAQLRCRKEARLQVAAGGCITVVQAPHSETCRKLFPRQALSA